MTSYEIHTLEQFFLTVGHNNFGNKIPLICNLELFSTLFCNKLASKEKNAIILQSSKLFFHYSHPVRIIVIQRNLQMIQFSTEKLEYAYK